MVPDGRGEKGIIGNYRQCGVFRNAQTPARAMPHPDSEKTRIPNDGLEDVMWNKNEREGKADQVKGQVKQAVGDLTGNDKLKAEGKVDETVGKAKTAVGAAQEKVDAAIKSVGKAVKR